jgi:putative ABC transport system permease protein
MYLKENIQLALEGLKANKMRALLTMLGIVIGISSVIAIMTVGDSLKASVANSMSIMGANNIRLSLRSKETFDLQAAVKVSESDLITDAMLENYLKMNGSRVRAVSLSAAGGAGKAQDGRKYANVTLTGTNSEYALANNLEIISGRFTKDADVKSNRNTAVVSDKLIGNMFGGAENPLGKEIAVVFGDSLQSYTIIGVFKHEASGLSFGGGGESDRDVRTNLYIPISTCRILTASPEGYQNITIMAETGVDTEKAAAQAEEFFSVYYAGNPNFEVQAMSMESIMESANSMMSVLSLAVAVIAGISLVVGGVGVMNIMLVSVTERTREIGTRRALGARSSAIRIQFIVEAIIICCLGGFLGVALGTGLGYLGSCLLGFPGLPSPFIVVLAFLFSALIGVFFGYYPANKASSLDPIEALRYE